MGLIGKYLTECKQVVETVTSDGQGGSRLTHSLGTAFMAAFVRNGDSNNRDDTASKITSHATYAMTTDKAISLGYHAIIKRTVDGRCFRVLTHAEDFHTPAGSALNMRQVTVEEWIEPDEYTPAE